MTKDEAQYQMYVYRATADRLEQDIAAKDQLLKGCMEQIRSLLEEYPTLRLRK